MSITIYHNPRCSKSRQTLQLLRENGVEPEIIEYLKEPPSVSVLKDILVKLELTALDIIRRDEKVFEEQHTDPDKLSNDELLAFMVKNPIVIQRPIVVRGTKAVLGRPPEKVITLL